MKRTLLEILGAMTVLVVLASFNHQLGRLKDQNTDVAHLRDMVQKAVTHVDATLDVAEARAHTLSEMNLKLNALEARVAEASSRGADSEALRAEIEATRREASSFQQAIARDVRSAQKQLGQYGDQIRSLDKTAQQRFGEARDQVMSLVETIRPNPSRLSSQLLAPTVQLNGDDTVGSGTLIYSRYNDATKRVESYVLTCYHVIRNILADTPSARRKGVSVTIYTKDGKTEERGDMICHDETIDTALVRLRSAKRFANTARTLPRSKIATVEVWDHVYAVGCPLGNDPIPTQGEVSSTHNMLGGTNYWMINAPTYFGNSGGGVFLADSCELIGVFSKIYTHGKGNPVVVPHMGLCTPISSIYEWLSKDNLTFVLEQPDAVDPAELAAPPR